MNSFNKYNQELRRVILDIVNNTKALTDDKKMQIKDAQQYLRDNESIATLRASGVFFTGDSLANECASYIYSDFEGLKVLDPCCGTGNLLIAVSKKLELGNGLTNTLSIWNRKLHGFDLYEEFVEATKLRIILEAIQRGADLENYELDHYLGILTNITCKNALELDAIKTNYNYILMNPPYNLSLIDDYKHWRSGKVNLAAVFLDYYILFSEVDTRFIAILPDVLRSGTRYAKWRDFVQNNLKAKIINKGRFDSKTDVDVFILVGKKQTINNGIKWVKYSSTLSPKKISDYFCVNIGKVVPHRDPLMGSDYPYIYPKSMVNWSEIDSKDLQENIQHQSKPISPPFVIIKRTSSPKDKCRATAQLITGEKPVFVENHLIVVKPLQPCIYLCRKLITHLKSKEVSDFLNDYIRCRHLTVKSIKEIPFEMEIT